MAGEIIVEQIAAEVVADTSKFLGAINNAVNMGTTVLGKGMDAAAKSGGGLGHSLTSAVGTFTKFAEGAYYVEHFAGSVKHLVTGLVEGNAEFEKYQTQFEVLLGSADAAKKRIEELEKFAAETPFELPDIVQASKLLQTFGGDAIATGETLTMVGDMASAAGVGFSEVATWVGRAYTSIQAGRPFGEASQRLQELGLMSGTTRQNLEDLQKSGVKGDELWKVFTDSTSKYTGMMKKQSLTWEGLTSTMNDGIAMLKRTVTAGLFEALKKPLGAFTTFLSSPILKHGAEAISKQIGKGMNLAIEFATSGVKKLQSIFMGLIAEDGFLNVVATKIALFLNPRAYGTSGVLGFWNTLKTIFDAVSQSAKAVFDVMKGGVGALADVKKSGSGAYDSVLSLGLAFNGVRIAVLAFWNLIKKLAPLVGKNLWKDFLNVWKALTPLLAQAVDVVEDLFNWLADLLGTTTENAKTVELLAFWIEKLIVGWIAFMALKKSFEIVQTVVHKGAELIKDVKDITQKVTQFFGLSGPPPVPCDDCEKEIKQDVQKPTGAKLEEDETIHKTIQQEVAPAPAPDDKALEDKAKKSGNKWAQTFITGVVSFFATAAAAHPVAAAIVAGVALALAGIGAAVYLGVEEFGLTLVESLTGAISGAIIGAGIGWLVAPLISVITSALLGTAAGTPFGGPIGMIVGAIIGAFVGVLTVAFGPEILDAILGVLADVFTVTNFGRVAGVAAVALLTVLFPPTLLILFRKELGKLADILFDVVAGIPEQLAGISLDIGKAVVDGILGIPDLLIDLPGQIVDVFLGLPDAIADFFASLTWDNVGEALIAGLSLGIVPALEALGVNTKQLLEDFVSGFVDTFFGAFRVEPQQLEKFGDDVVEAITGFVPRAVGAVGDLAGAIVGEIADVFARTDEMALVEDIGEGFLSALGYVFDPERIGSVIGTAISFAIAYIFPPTLIIKFRKQIFGFFSDVFTGGGEGGGGGLAGIATAAFNAVVECIIDFGPILAGAVQKAAELMLKGWLFLNTRLPLIVAGGFVKLIPVVAKGLLSIADFLYTELPVTIGKAFLDFAEELPGLILDALSGLGDIFSTLITDLGPKLILAWGNAELMILGAILTFVTQTLPSLILQGIPNLVSSVAQLMGNIGLSALAALGGVLGTFIEAGASIVNGLIDGLDGAFNDVIEWFGKLFESIWQTIVDFFELGSPSKLMARVGEDIIQGLLDGLNGALASLLGFFSGLPGAIIKALETYGTLASKFFDIGKNAIGAIAFGINYGLTALKLFLASIPGELLKGFEAFGSVFDLFKGLGKSIVEGIWEGIKDAKGWLEDKVGGFIGGIVNTAKEASGSKSPSTVFAAIGRDLMLGLAVGIEDETKRAIPRVERAMGAVVDAGQGILEGAFTAGGGLLEGLARPFSGTGKKKVAPAPVGTAAPHDHVVKTLDEMKIALAKYLDTVKLSGDALNDWLAYLPKEFRSLALAIGEQIAPMTGEFADKIRKELAEHGVKALIPGLNEYMQAVKDTGDAANDMLMHIPAEFRAFALSLGEKVAPMMGDFAQDIRDAVKPGGAHGPPLAPHPNATETPTLFKAILDKVRQGTATAADALMLIRAGLPDLATAVERGIAGLMPPADLWKQLQDEFKKWAAIPTPAPAVALAGTFYAARAPATELGTDNSSSFTNYGKVINVTGTRRQTVDVMHDIERMV